MRMTFPPSSSMARKGGNTDSDSGSSSDAALSAASDAERSSSDAAFSATVDDISASSLPSASIAAVLSFSGKALPHSMVDASIFCTWSRSTIFCPKKIRPATGYFSRDSCTRSSASVTTSYPVNCSGVMIKRPLTLSSSDKVSR